VRDITVGSSLLLCFLFGQFPASTLLLVPDVFPSLVTLLDRQAPELSLRYALFISKTYIIQVQVRLWSMRSALFRFTLFSDVPN
jgi:hypothetical protein